jgi:Fe-S oxidoreductase
MCPSYRATCDEKDTTRGRANSLRLAISGQSSPGSGTRNPMQERWLYDVMDLCLMCKACKAECPSNVDVAKLKAEFLSAYYEDRLRPIGHFVMANVHHLHRYGAWAGRFVNWAGRQPTARWLMEKFAGIDRRRSLPPIHADHFRRWFVRHTRDPGAGTVGRVILLDDCFTTFTEPEIGRAAVRVLERAGYAVELAGLTCCGRTLISKGFLRDARDLARSQLPDLARRVADGTPILGLEPSCLLTLADEWPDLVPGPAAERVAAAADLAEGWLAREVGAGRCELPLARQPATCLLHGHCHQKALRGTDGSAAALRLVPGLSVSVLDAGCCGMAGSFGYEHEHYDLSVQIAGLQLLPALRAEPEATVVATGTSCRHQIRDLAGRRAVHPVEVLAEAADKNG